MYLLELLAMNTSIGIIQTSEEQLTILLNIPSRHQYNVPKDPGFTFTRLLDTFLLFSSLSLITFYFSPLQISLFASFTYPHFYVPAVSVE
jgi:hypothetical protein